MNGNFQLFNRLVRGFFSRACRTDYESVDKTSCNITLLVLGFLSFVWIRLSPTPRSHYKCVTSSSRSLGRHVVPHGPRQANWEGI